VTATDSPRAVGSSVSLEVNAEHHMIRIARLVASGLAAIAGFDLDAVEDLRIAVDEGCVWLIDEGDGSPLQLAYAVRDDGAVEVAGRTGRGTGDGVVGPLVAQIMAAACDRHRFEVGEGSVSFTLVSRAPVPPADGSTGG